MWYGPVSVIHAGRRCSASYYRQGGRLCVQSAYGSIDAPIASDDPDDQKQQAQALFADLLAGRRPPIRSARVDKPVVDDAEHFIPCPHCRQAIDMRDLAQVFHHEGRGHRKLPRN